MLVKSITALALFASFAAAQTNSSTIDPNSVSPSTRSSWCAGQIDTCGRLCDGNNKENDCDTTTLQFDCLCASNSSQPGLQYYDITIPSYICQQVFANCDAANAGNKAGKDKCAEARKRDCGTLNPQNYTGGSATTSSAAATTSTAAATGSNAAVSTTSSSRAIAAPTGAANFGAGVLAAGVAAAFGMML